VSTIRLIKPIFKSQRNVKIKIEVTGMARGN